MLIPSLVNRHENMVSSLSRRVNANSQRNIENGEFSYKLIKKGEC